MMPTTDHLQTKHIHTNELKKKKQKNQKKNKKLFPEEEFTNNKVDALISRNRWNEHEITNENLFLN